MNDKDFLEAYSQEYYLLREIEAHLQMWHNMHPPLKAQNMITTIPTEKLAMLMAWAQVGLREHIVTQNRMKEVRNLTSEKAAEEKAFYALKGDNYD